jgi:hypothetical protein
MAKAKEDSSKSIGLNMKVYKSLVSNKVVKSFIDQKTPTAKILSFIVEDALTLPAKDLRDVIQSGVDITVNNKKDDQIANLKKQIKAIEESKVKS